MKKFIPDLNPIKVIPKVRDATAESLKKLSDKTLVKTEQAGNFLTEFADAILFIM
jgi:hypothetical protein